MRPAMTRSASPERGCHASIRAGTFLRRLDGPYENEIGSIGRRRFDGPELFTRSEMHRGNTIRLNLEVLDCMAPNCFRIGQDHCRDSESDEQWCPAPDAVRRVMPLAIHPR